ncbi:MAG: serine/threonine protein kinase [Gemmataceae bacterium]|nr:serine/threonine protein kinase [Gemmataceae bacterium]MDW8264452.1 serine/threonine-protein kinase [Gemmataceae bacterium]
MGQGIESSTHPSATFAQAILRSGLLDRDALRAVVQSAPPDRLATPQLFADYLVAIGKLSRFQANKLLKGAVIGLVLGPYHILAPIGKGGMGSVYLARDSRNQQLLALKILPPKRARTEERLRARFLREMEMCQRVAHPHLTQTYEVGQHLGVYYIAMEFIPGQTLHRLVRDQGPLSVPRAARLFVEVASGLEHAHQQGLIHRDLKPSNIMITPNDHAKILDLGLALMDNEEISDRSIVGGHRYIVGTMDYVAPEQAENSAAVDPRCDVYSLGCTLYYALTGQPPFPGGTSLQKIRRHLTEEPTPITELNPTVPIEFVRLVQWLMAKKPARRPASAAAVREALLPWAGQAPVAAIDQAGDAAYQRAVATLQEVDAEPEQLWEVIVGAHLGAVSPPPAAPPRRIRLKGTLPFWLDFLMPVGLGSLVLTGFWYLIFRWLVARW